MVNRFHARYSKVVEHACIGAVTTSPCLSFRPSLAIEVPGLSLKNATETYYSHRICRSR